ncbi:chemotaxis protein CheW [Sphingomonas sp. S1-29]|uniref:chemotaxis protein CheW n=1 Tax=Sphingomonas sp. S1-29 TaxID=2991074 RepID=UPI00223EDB04|nr:chemotaxis protein CheW [Sphingomonas sp. S1-29]UZK69808.1 chemotaxis protein CheW [Sphingomonas sp. S1-29]
MNDLYLIAHVAGRTVAIESASVESVVDIGPVTPVPRAADTVRGLATLRSRVVTVIDTQAALGIEPDGDMARRAIVTQVEGHHYAFLVDTLDDVAPFALQPLAGAVALEGAWAHAGRGLIERDGEPVLVIDLACLLPVAAE